MVNIYGASFSIYPTKYILTAGIKVLTNQSRKEAAIIIGWNQVHCPANMEGLTQTKQGVNNGLTQGWTHNSAFIPVLTPCLVYLQKWLD